MKHLIFAVHDVKAQAYLPPFILPNAGMAKRVFGDCVNSDSHEFGKHPADYTLFCFGEFIDHETEPFRIETKESLGNGVEFVEFSESNVKSAEPELELVNE